MMNHHARAPLHERFKPLGWIREPFRQALFTFFRKASETDDGRAIAARTLKGLLNPPATVLEGTRAVPTAPYAGLGQAEWQSQTALRSDVVFITARFRSGSTLLWNLFRHLDGCTSYYEPLNERRWFDPAARGDRIDATHRHAEEYWREYEGLSELGNYYQEDWIGRALFMDANYWEPNLKRYVEVLIERAPGRPVLQFNRIDFRLPWFRRHFPAAKLIHLYRHPRDQWCSALMDVKCCPPDAGMADFEPHDRFYLLNWARDLRYQFPFLDEQAVSHPYPLFYYLWKLSYLFGRKYAHHSLAFETLVEEPDTELPRLMQAVRVERYDLEPLKGLMVKPALGKWKEYADDAWFRRHEAHCETVLAEFLGHVPGTLANES